MPGLAPHPATNPDAVHVVFVPVSGAVVFSVCVLLIAACVVWFTVMCVQGRREE